MTVPPRLPSGREGLPPPQQAVYDEIALRRGTVPAPYLPLLASAEVANAFERFSAATWAGHLSADVQEAIFLLTAHAYRCSHQWRTHEGKAREAGVPEPAIQSLRGGRVPTTAEAGERLADVLRFAAELIDRKPVPQELFTAASRHFDDRGLADLVAFCALSVSVALLLNVREAVRQ